MKSMKYYFFTGIIAIYPIIFAMEPTIELPVTVVQQLEKILKQINVVELRETFIQSGADIWGTSTRGCFVKVEYRKSKLTNRERLEIHRIYMIRPRNPHKTITTLLLSSTHSKQQKHGQDNQK